MKKFILTVAIVFGLFGLTVGMGYMAERSIPNAEACSPPNC